MIEIEKKYNALKERLKSVVENYENEREELIQGQKMMENEVIALSAQKAHLEQVNDELSQHIEQREYEVVMLTEKDRIIRTQGMSITEAPNGLDTQINNYVTKQYEGFEESEEDEEENEEEINKLNLKPTNSNNNDKFEDFSADVDGILDLVFDQSSNEVKDKDNNNNNNSNLNNNNKDKKNQR